MSDMLNRYLMASDSYSDFLMHHGILGQKWGVRRFQNPDGSLTEEGKRRYGKAVYDKAKFNNLEKWGKSKDTNVLYVTGYSGSGKSTLAEYMSDKNTSAIHLDSYFDGPDEIKNSTDTNSRFNAFLDKNFPDYVKLNWPTDKITIEEWGQVMMGFEKQIERFGQSEFSSGRKVICEGVQLLDDTIQPDKTFFKDKPTAITQSNAITSSIRARQRDNAKLKGLKDIKREFDWYRVANREIRNFARLSR